MKAWSFTIFARSRLNLRSSFFIAASRFSIWELKMLIFTRITTSKMYAKKKGVSPVTDLGVVWNAHNINGSSSSHYPFALSSLFFSPLKIVQLATSITSLDYG